MSERGGVRALIRTLAGAFVAFVTVRWLLSALPVWKIRLAGARLSRRFPPGLVPKPFRVLPPPNEEYLGVWERPPAAARASLIEEYEFRQMIRAYLHAYEQDGSMQYEVASCAYRPDGILGRWQLHVRLFPTAEGHTDVWCHWELNPNVAPIAHLRQEGYDPEEGKRHLRAILEDPLVEPRRSGTQT